MVPGATTSAQETPPATPPPSISAPEASTTAPEASTSPSEAPPVATPTEQPATPPPAPETAAAPSAPESTDSALSQALSAYEKQDFSAAADALKNVIDADPTSVKAHFYLGYALYKLKRFDESRVEFAQAYQLQSNYLPPITAPK
ncbi:MAG: tetratricopeptide repeat protein [Nitrospirae bacterium]|nr:tetratricopeptide repeat protein [Nitrospirota bacterium]